jgi:hypothetical protein
MAALEDTAASGHCVEWMGKRVVIQIKIGLVKSENGVMG